jgi:hypothetical protein
MARKPPRKRAKTARAAAALAPRPFDITQAVAADAVLSAQIKAAARLGYQPAEPSSAAAAAAVAAAVKPGKERWPVKTGQDKGASKVGLKPGSTQHVIVDTTVEELVEIARPKGMTDVTKNPKAFQATRAAPVEFTVWRITATVTAVKNEADGDLHLALQGESGETMIAESTRPNAQFVGKKNPWLPAITKVRTAIEGELKAALSGVQLVLDNDGKLVPPDSFEPSRLTAAAVAAPVDAAAALDAGLAFKARIEPRKAQLTGVGFFDKVHGQLGVSSFNGIELHPLLDFKWM